MRVDLLNHRLGEHDGELRMGVPGEDKRCAVWKIEDATIVSTNRATSLFVDEEGLGREEANRGRRNVEGTSPDRTNGPVHVLDDPFNFTNPVNFDDGVDAFKTFNVCGLNFGDEVGDAGGDRPRGTRIQDDGMLVLTDVSAIYTGKVRRDGIVGRKGRKRYDRRPTEVDGDEGLTVRKEIAIGDRVIGR